MVELVGYLFPLNWTISTGDDIVTELYAKINENNKKGWSNSIDKTRDYSIFDRWSHRLYTGKII